MLRPQDQIPVLGALHLAELSALVALASMSASRLQRGLPLMRLTPDAVGLLLFGAAILWSVPFSVWQGGSFSLFSDVYVKVLIVFVLMANTLSTSKRIDEITGLIVFSCGYIALRSLADYSRGVNLVEGDRLAGAVGGMFGNPNDLAMNMVTFLPAALVMAAGQYYPTGRRMLATVAALAMFATIVLTKSRGGMLGLMAAVMTLILLGRYVRPRLGTITLAVLLMAVPFLPASFWDRMATITDSKKDRQAFTGSRDARVTVMREGIGVFLERPLTGVGAGVFSAYNPPGRKERWRETHNAPIQVAAETGIFGLLAFSFLLIRAARGTTATRRSLRPHAVSSEVTAVAMTESERRMMQAHAVAMTAGLAGWFICALFASVAYNWTFYYLFALIVASREWAKTRHLLAPLVRLASPPGGNLVRTRR